MSPLRKLLPLYAVVFLGFFGYALTIALFIPMLMNTHFPLLPQMTSTSVRVSLSGLLLAMYPLGQFLGSPIIGNLSDHFGRKKVLLLSLAACLLGLVGMALSIQCHQLVLLFISAFLTGLCESNMAISQSIIVGYFHDSAEKTKWIGYAYSACSLGYIAGPLLGGIGGSLLGYGAPFAITAVGVLGLIVWIAYGFEDPFIPHKQSSIKILESLLVFKSLFTRSKLTSIYLINFLIFFAVQGLYRVVPLYVVDKWQPSLQMYALLIAFVSLVCFLANLFILGAATNRFSTQKLLSYLLFIGAILIVLMIVPNQFYGLWIIYGLVAIPTVMALPLCTSWLSGHVAVNAQGQVLGNNQALLVLGESTSAAIGGLIAAVWVPLPIIVMGIILCFAGVMVVKSSPLEGA